MGEKNPTKSERFNVLWRLYRNSERLEQWKKKKKKIGNPTNRPRQLSLYEHNNRTVSESRKKLPDKIMYVHTDKKKTRKTFHLLFAVSTFSICLSAFYSRDSRNARRVYLYRRVSRQGQKYGNLKSPCCGGYIHFTYCTICMSVYSTHVHNTYVYCIHTTYVYCLQAKVKTITFLWFDSHRIRSPTKVSAFTLHSLRIVVCTSKSRQNQYKSAGYIFFCYFFFFFVVPIRRENSNSKL